MHFLLVMCFGIINCFWEGERPTVLKVGSLNCQGLNDYYKRMTLFDSFKRSDVSILFLQETKLKPELEYEYVREWDIGESIFNSTVGSKSGTAILINNPAIKLLSGTKMVDIEGRVISVNIEIHGTIFHLVNSYGPNEGRLRVPFLNRLYLYLNSNVPIIWGGDHNLTTNPRVDRFPTKFDSDCGGRDVLDILNTFNMKDACRELYPNSSVFTFRRGTSRSRIDKICVSEGLLVRSYVQEDGFSDHELIKVGVQFETGFNRGPGVWRNNVKYYKEESFLEDFRVFWTECIDSNFNYSRNVVNWWMDFKYKFKLYYIKYSRQKLLLSRRHDQIMEGALFEAVRALNQNPNSRLFVNNYNKIKKDFVDSKIKKMKEKIFKSDAQYLMQGERPIKSFFDKFKNKRENKPMSSLKNSRGREVFDIQGIIKVVEEYYKELYTPGEVRQSIMNLFLNNIRPVDGCDALMNALMQPISLEEIWDAIVSFINNKSPGPDGITAEFYKIVFSVIKHDLRRVLNQFLNGHKIPAKSKAGLITLVPKVGPVNEIENYRPISLLNTDYKIFTKILKARLDPILEKNHS